MLRRGMVSLKLILSLKNMHIIYIKHSLTKQIIVAALELDGLKQELGTVM
jgi:hypothetical protein